MKFIRSCFITLCILSLITGCGGGTNDSDNPPQDVGPFNVTLSGTVGTGMSSTSAMSKSNSDLEVSHSASVNSAIANGTIEVYSKSGTLLIDGVTDENGNFTVQVDSGNDYFVKALSSDGETIVKAYVSTVGSSGQNNIIVNAYSSAVVHSMEQELNVTFTSTDNGYSGSQSLSSIATDIKGSDGFSSLVKSVQTDLVFGNSGGFSEREILVGDWDITNNPATLGQIHNFYSDGTFSVTYQNDLLSSGIWYLNGSTFKHKILECSGTNCFKDVVFTFPNTIVDTTKDPNTFFWGLPLLLFFTDQNDNMGVLLKTNNSSTNLVGTYVMLNDFCDGQDNSIIVFDSDNSWSLDDHTTLYTGAYSASETNITITPNEEGTVGECWQFDNSPFEWSINWLSYINPTTGAPIPEDEIVWDDMAEIFYNLVRL